MTGDERIRAATRAALPEIDTDRWSVGQCESWLREVLCAPELRDLPGHAVVGMIVSDDYAKRVNALLDRLRAAGPIACWDLTRVFTGDVP